MSGFPNNMFFDHDEGTMIPIPRHAFPGEVTSFENSPLFWKETPDGHFELKANLPGFKNEDVKVNLEEGGVLCIRGEKIVERVENSRHGHRVARSSSTYSRKVSLPENAMPGRFMVFMENGVLTVTVPQENINNSRPQNCDHII